ncbi:MAG: class I SAM-dependent methyltransferase [Ardenticatenaceae bacterium]|nr:class I SAM-dependent methyltransferase [Ardenticatenaceae bacterium]
MTPNYQNPDNLRRDQYKDASNLDARVALHSQFTISAQPWQTWVFDQIALQPGERVLECGGGPGWLWRENLDRLPADCHITFTDLSEGMIAEAQTALAQAGDHFTFQTANIMGLPFEDGSFDVVVANHMLYHVPDRPAALAEIKRVLQTNGRFLAATNGKNHLAELRQLGRDLVPLSGVTPEELPPGAGFRLEDGRFQLQPYFNQIELRLYDSHLAVTEARRQQVAQQVQQIIAEEGYFHISKDTGIFIAHP